MRNFQQIRTSYWDNARNREAPLSADEILVELFLISCPQCGSSGVYIFNTETIGYYTGLGTATGENERDIFGSPKIKAVMESLAAKNRIRIYPGGWVWIVGKWEFESRNPMMQRGLFVELETAPRSLIRDFMDKYRDTITEALPQTLSKRVSDTHPTTRGALEEHYNFSAGSADGIQNPEPKLRKSTPLSESTQSTPHGQALKYWCVKFKRRFGIEPEIGAQGMKAFKGWFDSGKLNPGKATALIDFWFSKKPDQYNGNLTFSSFQKQIDKTIVDCLNRKVVFKCPDCGATVPNDDHHYYQSWRCDKCHAERNGR